MDKTTRKPFTLFLFLCWASAIVRSRGYLSRSKAITRPATADLAWQACCTVGAQGAVAHLEDGDTAILTMADEQNAQATMEALQGYFDTLNGVDFYKSGESRDSYENKVARILTERRVDRRDSGYAASMLPLVARIRERASADNARKELAKDAAHVGRVGERIKLAATLERAQWRDSDYGGYYLLAFRDSAGNELVWFSGSAGAERTAKLGEGAKVQLVATVKEHGEFRGVPNTKLTRCAVTPA